MKCSQQVVYNEWLKRTKNEWNEWRMNSMSELANKQEWMTAAGADNPREMELLKKERMNN